MCLTQPPANRYFPGGNGSLLSPASPLEPLLGHFCPLSALSCSLCTGGDLPQGKRGNKVQGFGFYIGFQEVQTVSCRCVVFALVYAASMAVKFTLK